MSLKIVIQGEKLDLADELGEEFVAPAKEAVREAAGLLLTDVQRRLRQRRGTRRTAAPAGQPPEEDTGELAGSFRVIPPRVRGRIASSGIESHHPGGNRLENGAVDVRGIRTLPHPFLRPAIEATEGPIGDLLQARLS